MLSGYHNTSDPYARALAYSSRHGLQIHRCISILLNNIYQYYCFLNICGFFWLPITITYVTTITFYLKNVGCIPSAPSNSSTSRRFVIYRSSMSIPQGTNRNEYLTLPCYLFFKEAAAGKGTRVELRYDWHAIKARNHASTHQITGSFQLHEEPRSSIPLITWRMCAWNIWLSCFTLSTGNRRYSQGLRWDGIRDIYLSGIPSLFNFIECDNRDLCRARVD